MKDLTILHLSDLHCRNREANEFAIRREALLKDLRMMQLKPDLLVVSGDIAFSGQGGEYEFAQTEFFEPIQRELDVPVERIIVCPGNHDIARNVIDEVVKQGISSHLTDSEKVQSLLAHPTHILPQEANYMAFLSALSGRAVEFPFASKTLSLRGMSLGIAIFDSAWLCSDDDTMHKIFLTRKQVGDLSAEVAGCDIKIGIMHHPLDWFHPSEGEVVQRDLRGTFDLLLIGHKHQVDSLVKISPSEECLELTAASFFAGDARGRTDGYNIYSVDSKTRQVKASFRAFIRQRKAYDSNVQHAQGGAFTYALPNTAFPNAVSMAIARRVTESSNAISAQMSEGLRRAQGLETPILVTPVVEQMDWDEGGQNFRRIKEPYAVAMGSSCILYAPPDVGSTTFLQELCQRIDGESSRLAVFLEFAEVANAQTEAQLRKRVVKASGLSEEEFSSLDVTLVIDHLLGVDSDAIVNLLTLLTDVDQVVLCLKNEVLFDTLAAALKEDDLIFLRIRYWGPSRLREFTSRYVEAAGIAVDVDAAYKYISSSLAISDIPVTPFLVALYLRVFFEDGGTLTSVTFVRLLERLEGSSLDRAQPDSNYSIYNLRLMLRKLAAWSYEVGDLGIDRERFENAIEEYFTHRALSVNSRHFVELLEASGILMTEAEGKIVFSCVVFFNYYLAQAVEKGEVDLQGHLQELHSALRLGDALSYYAGQHRDEERLAVELMRCLEEQYSPDEGISSATALEKYIKRMLSPAQDPKDKDAVANEAVDSTVDYEAADAGFEREQNDYRAAGQRLMRVSPPRDRLEKVAWNIIALKTFYNVFRNLEHIPGSLKKRLLNRILDFHLQCNTDLIELYSDAMEDEDFTSLCAYMVTIGGEVFLSRNVGSVSLRETIDELLEEDIGDLKTFLLHCIYADLGLPEYAGRIERFLSSSDSIALLEMGYAKVHLLLIQHEGPVLPTSLISAFNTAFDRRTTYYRRIAPIDLQRLRDKAFNQVKRRFLQNRAEQGVLWERVANE